MDIESQKFMALEGIHTWGEGVIQHVRALNDFPRKLASRSSHVPFSHVPLIRQFQRDKLAFLIAANQLVQYVVWAREIGVVAIDAGTDLQKHSSEIRDIRNKNEHVIEYFSGNGHAPKTWVYTDDGGTADASSTVDSRIGGRLDWNEVAAASETLLKEIPLFYYPNDTI